MTITPRWNEDENVKTPTGLPSVGKAPNLSDFDVTQPSLRVAGVQRSQRRQVPQLSSSTSSDASQAAIDNSVTRVNTANVDPLVGTIFAERYEVLELLGRGGMGAVYKVRNRINKNLRALKLMHAHLVADPQVFRRFQQEATAAARINHPNAITIIDMGMAADGRPYLIMDFLDGMSLSELLKYKTKLPIRYALDIFVQMCRALTEAHNHGVIHRDIKPSNVMLLDGDKPDSYVVKVVDFGIAKVFPQEGDPTMKDTTTGELFGSPPYMSPEQCLGKRLDYRSDIYSLGCLMYEVLTGAPPLVGQNALGTMYRQINDLPTPLAHLEEDIRLIQSLDKIITKTLEKSPESRYQNIPELVLDLETVGEVAYAKSRFVAGLSLKVHEVYRVLKNTMGSSKRTTLFVLLGCSMGLSVILILVASFYTERALNSGERKIVWRQVTNDLSGDYLQRRVAVLSSQLNEARASFGNDSGEALGMRNQLAACYFSSHQFKRALEEYSQGCNVGKLLLQDRFLKCRDKSKAIDDFSIAQLRRMLCIQALATADMSDKTDSPIVVASGVNFDDYSETAEDLLANLTSSDVQSQVDKAYMYSTLGLVAQAANKTGSYTVNLAATKFFSKALDCWAAEDRLITRWIKYGPRPTAKLMEPAEIFATVLSQIGDYYRDFGDQRLQQEAARAYMMAEPAWSLFGLRDIRGYVNGAFAEDNYGLSQLRLSHPKEATVSIQKAVIWLEKLKQENSLDFAKLLFDESDAEWSSGHYLEAVRLKRRATVLWAEQNH